jgi:EpsD family peptidyl-prolyl cis-trans isomerase
MRVNIQTVAFRRIAQVAALGLVCLAACGKGGEEKATQVAARVNGAEITVHQVNQTMQRLGAVPEGQAKQATKQVLDRLVDQQLLVEQAKEKKLDRDPRIVAAIEAGRRQILAQAYVEQVAGGAPKATSDQVKDFYAQHPELFQERRIYRFLQMAIAMPADKQQAVRAKVEELDKTGDKQKIFPQLAEWLRGQNLQFQVNQTTQPAEQLPLEALPKYAQMKAGDLVFTPAPKGAVVSQLVATQPQPLNQAQAEPYIEQYLVGRERLKLSDDEMKRLRAAAKIEYVGEFAKLEQSSASSAPPSADSASKPDASASGAEQPTASHQDVMTKGVKALK